MSFDNEYVTVFHHIPKTAGTTLLDIVPRLYGTGNCYVIDGIETDCDVAKFREMSVLEKARYPVVIGHQAIMLYQDIPVKKRVVTFFRDPYKQFVSNYYYLREAKNNRKHHHRVKNLNLVEFLDYCIDNELNNPQAKVLFTAHYEDVTDIGEIRKGALQGLEKIDYPCITECFDLSLMLLRRELSWGCWSYYVRKNQSNKAGYFFSQELFEKHKSHNEVDYLIYDKAVERFWALVTEEDRASLKTFNRRNVAYKYMKKLRIA
ncbi:sulfotransferase family 2 domain-containing protein [Alcanivorax sp.]|uniref:sulfotransferase family 2 domain-containing protein n=1 Tax=Alcanivorax sp. TaxID=1872427 RepID=UPI0025BF9236|nr:sulfotransferase family 2 domain-containing protein [Alcanivorax sp.]